MCDVWMWWWDRALPHLGQQSGATWPHCKKGGWHCSLPIGQGRIYQVTSGYDSGCMCTGMIGSAELALSGRPRRGSAETLTNTGTRPDGAAVANVTKRLLRSDDDIEEIRKSDGGRVQGGGKGRWGGVREAQSAYWGRKVNFGGERCAAPRAATEADS
ncbi:unnamed protein product [Boreogadus saida]